MFRLSSTTNLHANFNKDIHKDTSAFLRDELAFQNKMGFLATDLSLHQIISRHADDYEGVIERAKEDATSFGMKFELCHLPFNAKIAKDPSGLPQFNALLHKMIDAAALLGVDYAVLHPNTSTVARLKLDKSKEYDSVMNHVAPFVEHANRVGVNIVIENMRPVPENYMVHRYCQDPDELCDIADALGIGVCWDFGHAHIAGLRQSEAIEYVGKRLKVLHVNDNLGEDDIHLPPFCGNIDWKDAMKGLARVGFRGLFNYEIATTNVPAHMREAFARYLVDAAKELTSYIGE